MRLDMMCIEEGYRTFKSKGVEQKEYVVSLVDMGEPVSCDNAFAVTLEGEEKDKHHGKLKGKRVTVDVQHIQQRFDGQVRLTGKLAVNGASK